MEATNGFARDRSSTSNTVFWIRRRPGRPSVALRYAPSIREWIREDPELSGAEVLRRVRALGYDGGKTALYELVRRLRAEAPPSQP